ncbi:hypothetical protein CJD44_03200 [Streptomyces sp. alain-838]|nr:hypothetical protein CJD44_03200 [Streptomyces sp. alain-838]
MKAPRLSAPRLFPAPVSGLLARLFPEAPGGADPWLTLLWATGRAELPGHPRLTTWRSDSTPRA